MAMQSLGMIILILAVLLVVGVPISYSIGIASLFTILQTVPLDISVVTGAQRIFVGMSKFSLTAIPFFILAGNLMNQGGIAKRLVNFVMAILGKLRPITIWGIGGASTPAGDVILGNPIVLKHNVKVQGWCRGTLVRSQPTDTHFVVENIIDIFNIYISPSYHLNSLRTESGRDDTDIAVCLLIRSFPIIGQLGHRRINPTNIKCSIRNCRRISNTRAWRNSEGNQWFFFGDHLGEGRESRIPAAAYRSGYAV